MRRFEVGDQVRIDIPDREDPDHSRLHRKTGMIVEVFEDDAGSETGYPRDSYLFRVDTGDGNTENLRWRDLRPVENNSR